jgi:hypothetical protein
MLRSSWSGMQVEGEKGRIEEVNGALKHLVF